MKILFINNEGGGFADYVEIGDGMTVMKCFEEQMSGKPADYLIRVNREQVSNDYMLREGDRVSMTPVKVEGAHHSL